MPSPVPPCGGAPSTPVPAVLSAVRDGVERAFRIIPAALSFGIRAPTAFRYLHLDEQRVANAVFGASLDYTTILISDGLGMSGRPFTVAVPTGAGSFVIMNIGSTAACWATHRPALLIHELVHAWQSQHHPDATGFMTNSVRCQAQAILAVPAAKAAAGAVAARAAIGRGVIGPAALAAAARAAAATEDVSAYAYVPGKPFGAYAAEQIAQQIEDSFNRTGRPTSGIAPIIRGATRRAAIPENVASLGVISFHAKSTPGVVFR
jgi:hypothetical protein